MEHKATSGRISDGHAHPHHGHPASHGTCQGHACASAHAATPGSGDGSGYETRHESRHESSHESGHESGHKADHKAGHEAGHEAGHKCGHESGPESGRESGPESAHAADHAAHDCCGDTASESSEGCCASVAEPLTPAPAAACCAGHACGPASASRPAVEPALHAAAGQTLSRVRIGQMDCPTEEGLIRKKLDGMADVHGLHFDLMQRILTVVHNTPALDNVLAAIRALGMTPELLQAGATPAPPAAARTNWWQLGTAGLLAVAAEAAHYVHALPALTAGLALASILICGLNTYKKGWVAIRHGNLNINALMSIAVTGAALIGQWPEAAMVMFLFTVAEIIEARSLDRARNAVRGLLDLAPQRATVRQADGSWRDVPAAALTVGDVVRVRPGERIAADGTITTGASAVDQSAITGESTPADKTTGDPVYAATVNAAGSFEYRVTAAAGDTTLARIIHAIEQAQGARAPVQRFIDRFSRIYTPAVVVLAALVAVIPPLFFGHAWADAVYRALALLIIACPCALVISTPVTIVSGLTAASRRGILVKGGAYLENGRHLRWLALDKTGTLTHGKPALVSIDPWQAPGTAPLADVARPAQIAASLAARSDHPVSRAVAAAAQAAPDSVSDFTALPGRGISGRVGTGLFYLGNRRLMRELGVSTPALEQALDEREARGSSTVVLSDGKSILAIAAVADTLRPASAQAVAELHALGVTTMMLSGDNTATVRAIAQQVGIQHAFGDQLPEDKLTALEAHMGDGLVGMVGDGINDGPALARADIGFAMGAAGTGTAIETADVALMDDDLRKIPEFIRLSRQTHQVLVQNIVLALGIKAVFLILALSGAATLWMAVFADVGASLLVVANGMRMLRGARGAGDARAKWQGQPMAAS